MHWHNFRVTILVHITYRQNFDFDPATPKSRLLKEMHYYVSNDSNHDTLFVQHAFLLHWNFLQSRGFRPSRHVMWFDGCFGQFKSARAWYFVFHYFNVTSNQLHMVWCQMLQNFFAIGHGKGEVDGIGVLLKREVQKEQIKPQGKKLQNAVEVIAHLEVEASKFHATPPST